MRIPRRTALVCAAIASAVLLLTAATSHQTSTSSVNPTATAPLAASGGDCGGAVLAKPTGGTWSCTFDDEFDESSLDTSDWVVMNTAATGFHAGVECYTPANVSLSGGDLILSATRAAHATKCGSSLSTQYDSGMLTTLGTFAQTDGMFQIRAQLPAGIGMHPAFWLLPQNPTANGGYEYGEIDVAEAWGSYPNIVSPHLHYVTTPGNPDSGANCLVAGSASAFHTYTLQWSSTQMSFLYDGKTCWQTSWTPIYPYAPAGAKAPAPFDQPFYLLVELAIDGPSTPTDAVKPSTKLPAKMVIDYVRAWN